MNAAIFAIVEEFLESSSSDSDSEFIDLIREKTKRPKINNYIVDVVHVYSDKQFKDSFRMNRDTCEVLIKDFTFSAFYPGSESHAGSLISSAENHILSFVWFAGNKCCIRDVAERFGIGQTTCFRQIIRVMNYLLDIAPRIIKFPRATEEKKIMANEFRKITGLPGVLGCVDGTSITVRTPAHKIKSTYVNRHDIPSVTLQGICDHRRKFIDVFTGPPGKIHDSRVYKLSFNGNELPNICNKEYHILGDNAYHLREHLLTPYRNYENISDAQRHYNLKFSGTRVLIENSFGILKGRFRQLTCLDFHKVEKITNFIISCCVLHNLCIDNNDDIDIDFEGEDDDDDLVDQHNDITNDREMILRRLDEIKRDNLCILLQN